MDVVIWLAIGLAIIFRKRIRQEVKDFLHWRRSLHWDRLIERAKIEIPDFAQVIGSSEVEITESLRDMLFRSKYGPRILYMLARNPHVVVSLNDMDPKAQRAALAAIESAVRIESAIAKS